MSAEAEADPYPDAPADVCVIGAGPVGLTLAIALRRLSLRVRIVDKAPATKREPRALVIWPRAVEALAAIGVGETLWRNGHPLSTVNIYGEGRHLGELRTGAIESSYPRPTNIEQHETERHLAEELARLGVTVERSTEATDVKVHDDRAEITLRLPDGGTELVTAAWVVGCEGTRSLVRDRLDIPFEGRRRPGLQVVQGNAHASWRFGEQPGHGFFFLAPHRSLLAFPLPGGGYRFFCFRDDPDPARTEPPTLDELRDLIADTARTPELRLEPSDPVWLNRARFSDRVAARLRHGRGLIAGDAAHAWAPVGGHGMNMGILGACNLAWKLAAVHHGHADERLLDTYSTEQHAMAWRMIRDMRLNFMELPLPPLGYRAFTTALPATLASPLFQRRLEWGLSDLGRNHRGSPLSWHRPGRRPRYGPRAGDRVPDVTVIRPNPGNGAPVRLHRLLGYDHWTLLLPAARADAATLSALRAACEIFPAPVELLPVAVRDRAAARRLGHAGDFRLIRPDGHIGLVAPLDRADLLRDYLAALLSPDPSS
ncbi:FAD-dependent monooxygenase [Streptomyces sp. NPDC000410]|uniref:FAD-dependent monooxygenase n=1 Tax=Streptomyces sp. NPDC000410 TaxID=3154254 RepID=UPI00331DAF3A